MFFPQIENSVQKNAMVLLLRRYQTVDRGCYDRSRRYALEATSVAVRGRAVTLCRYSNAIMCY